MDEATLAGIEQRAEAATQGPWRWAYPGSDSPELHGVAGDEYYTYEAAVLLAEHDGGCACRKACSLSVAISEADAEFIAHARTDVPALVAEVRRLSAALAEQRAKVLREALHEAWLAVHVHRFDKQDDATAKPDSFYSGVIHSEHQITEVAARYGIDWHQLRAAPSVGWRCSHTPRCADSACSDNPAMQQWIAGMAAAPSGEPNTEEKP